jgi:hypothetical protein
MFCCRVRTQQFEEEAAAERAVMALDKRWFGGKRIQAQTYDADRFARNDFAA